MINLDEIFKFAENLVLKAGKFLIEKQNKVRIEQYKDRQDIVTNVDLQIEEIIIQAIEKKYPTHNILSEEKGLINKGGKYTWYIDPLDGTKEYYRRLPDYCVSLCLSFKKKPLLAWVNLPHLDQLFSVLDGKGSFFNGKKIHVNQQKNLKDSIIYINPPCYEKMAEKDFKKSFNKMASLTKNAYRLRYSSKQNIYLSFLALGSLEAFLNFTYPGSIEDFIPGLLIAKMAGAKITDLKGKKIDSGVGKLYIASNGKIHNQLLDLIN